MARLRVRYLYGKLLPFVCLSMLACGSSSSPSTAADASTGPDASFHPSASFASVRCGTKDCAGDTPVCCGRFDGKDLTQTCLASEDDCEHPNAVALCDGPPDCQSGDVCCYPFLGGKTYKIACTPESSCQGQGTMQPYRVCRVPEDCPSTHPACCFSGVQGILIGTCQAKCP